MQAAPVKYRARNMSARDFGKRWPAQQLRPVSVRWRDAGDQVFQAVLVAREAQANELKAPLAGGLRAYETIRGEKGVLGCALTTRKGTPVWFRAGPRPRGSGA